MASSAPPWPANWPIVKDQKWQRTSGRCSPDDLRAFIDGLADKEVPVSYEKGIGAATCPAHAPGAHPDSGDETCSTFSPGPYSDSGVEMCSTCFACKMVDGEQFKGEEEGRTVSRHEDAGVRDPGKDFAAPLSPPKPSGTQGPTLSASAWQARPEESKLLALKAWIGSK